MHTNPMETWEVNAITTEIEITKDINVRQTRLECPWCVKKHLVVLDKTRKATGHMLCANCGQFFRWLVHEEESATRRICGKPKRGSINHGQTGRISENRF